MTNLASPALRDLSVFAIPREYLPLFVTRESDEMIDSRARDCFLRPILVQKGGHNRFYRSQNIKHVTKIIVTNNGTSSFLNHYFFSFNNPNQLELNKKTISIYIYIYTTYI